MLLDPRRKEKALVSDFPSCDTQHDVTLTLFQGHVELER